MAKSCIKRKVPLKEKVLEILRLIEKEDIADNEIGFSLDKNAINLLFERTSEKSYMDIFIRLTVIDSTYSTQMTRRYYGLDELSRAIFLVKKNNPDKTLSELFVDYLSNRDITPFKYINPEDKRETDLFNEKYGIGKNGGEKGIALSLICKYAYFETRGEFPIYDSIACEMIPLMWKKCHFEGKCPPLSENPNLSGAAKLNRFLDALDAFKKNLGIEVSNDHLDRLLWFVGKIIRGNLSLVLRRKDYVWCSNHGFITKQDKETKFRIETVELKDLPFLQPHSLLYRFFELAKILKIKY